MTKRHKMTVEMPVKLHNQVRESAGELGYSQNEYVRKVLSEQTSWENDYATTIDRINKALRKAGNGLEIWRAFAIAFFSWLLVLCFLYGSLQGKCPPKEGVPVKDDVRTCQYYKTVLANKCKIEER